MTPLVDFPMPGISWRVPASARSRSSAGVERLQRLDGVAEGLDPVGAGPGALEEERDAAQRLDRVDRGVERLEQGDHQSPNCRVTMRSQTRSPPRVRAVTMARAAGVRR